MDDTRQTIDKILSEIEDSSIGKNIYGKKSVKQVMEILLEKKIDMNEQMLDADVSKALGLDMEELKRWRDKNNQIYSVNTDHPLYSNRPVIGKLVVFIKRVVRKIIRPIIYSIVTEQNEFNASVTASINALYNNEVTTNAFIMAQENYNDTVKQAEKKILDLQRKIEDLNKEIDALKVEYSYQEDKIPTLQNADCEEDVYSIIDYNKFENHFRGTKEEIKNSQRMYLPYFEGKKDVVDLGCGRGEFLELLKEKNINAIGVDTYSDFVKECRKKKLKVVQADALGYICEREDETLDGIFAAQLAEHLKMSELAQLCQQAYSKLKFGGCLILETPNPTCLSIYTNAFYIDPTHSKPVHPKTLEYLLRDAGFSSVEILYTEDSRVDYKLPLLNIAGVENLQEINDAINLLTDLIFGSQNYAIIAKK